RLQGDWGSDVCSSDLTAPDPAEYAARNLANIAWMQTTFHVALSRRSAAVMLITQGNHGWDLTDGARAPLRDPKTLMQTDGQPDRSEERRVGKEGGGRR